MKKVFFLFLLFAFLHVKAQIIINEIQASNVSTLADNVGDYDDWLELKNSSDHAIDIGGLVLKDNVDIWTIPTGDTSTILTPGDYFLLWCDDEEYEGSFHTNFKLSASNGEFLGLYESDSSTVIDSVTFPPLSDNASYGRCHATNEWTLFYHATPLTENECPSLKTEKSTGTCKVFPKLTTGKINIEKSVTINMEIEYKIFDMTGTLRKSGTNDQSRFVLNIETLPDGIYFVSLRLENRTQTEKIVLYH
ncbi:MAG: lamin tail domain-containing protein [Bacteroidales bacterium]|nr:lamin tail domain-containing protein [Bacteroidales bacterium]